MELYNKDLLTELNDKIQHKTTPTDKDKELLQQQINQKLSEEDHLYIFTEILQSMDKKIYTITENGTLFDLNDLNPEDFWKICYHTQIFIDNSARQQEINKAMEENNQLNNKFHQQVQRDLQKIKPDMPNINNNITAYETLRINALEQCSYSNYSPQKNNTTPLDKNIYCDNFQYQQPYTKYDNEHKNHKIQLSLCIKNKKQYDD